MPLTYTGTTIGTIKIKQDDEIFDLQIRQGNCLAVIIYVREATPEELEKNPEGRWYHSLWSFYCDEKHMENIIKNEGDIFFGEDVVSVSLNMYYEECYTLLKYFTKSGHEVVCRYEPESVQPSKLNLKIK